ncbi:hypothetical protein ACI3EY_16840 [Ornithinimicrobium sp. LYQ92]|uniref:hypothetical protein n=1 Tax=Serinicoccus sp. LYQ92 TaxID=3378798 RepID=UPI003855383E
MNVYSERENDYSLVSLRTAQRIPFWNHVDSAPRWTPGWAKALDDSEPWSATREDDFCLAMNSNRERCANPSDQGAPLCGFHTKRAVEWFLSYAGRYVLANWERGVEQLSRDADALFRAVEALEKSQHTGREDRVYFYLLPESGLVKIGTSLQPKVRAKIFAQGKGCTWPKGASPEGGHLLGTIPGGRIVEGSLHLEFRGSRVAGEWFRYEEVRPAIDVLLSAELAESEVAS